MKTETPFTYDEAVNNLVVLFTVHDKVYTLIHTGATGDTRIYDDITLEEVNLGFKIHLEWLITKISREFSKKKARQICRDSLAKYHKEVKPSGPSGKYITGAVKHYYRAIEE